MSKQATQEADTAALEAAAAEVEAATAAKEPDDLAKSLAQALERLEALEKSGYTATKGAASGFDDNKKAAPNKEDKSSPKGSGKPSGGYATGDAEEKPDNAGSRVSASEKVHATTPAPATTLNKGDRDEAEMNGEEDGRNEEDEDEEEKAEEGKTKKSEAAVTEDSIYKTLTTGDGSEEYMQVVDSSDALAFQAEVLAKGMAKISAQVADGLTALHARMDTLEKSQAALISAGAVMLKSQAKVATDTETLKKTPATPASGIVHTIVATNAEAAGTAPARTALFKSVSKAIADGKLTGEVGSTILARLDTQPVDRVWETLPPKVREAIGNE